MCMLSILIICRWNFENPFNSSQVIQENVVFIGHFDFFSSEPEVDFENQNFSHVHAIYSDHMPFEF